MFLMAGVLLLLNPPGRALAQEGGPPAREKAPDKPDDGPPGPKGRGKGGPMEHRREGPHGPGRGPAQEGPARERSVAFIGVLTRPVPHELRSQFSLPEGFGLMVDEVMPDTPAQTAGLKAHDILVKLGDQRLVNMEQLMTLVRSQKKGEVISLTVISGGQESVVSVTVGERMMPVPPPGPAEGGRFIPMDRYRDGEGPDGPRWSQPRQESMEQFERRMREYQERVRDWNRDGGRGQFPPPPVFDMDWLWRDEGRRGEDDRVRDDKYDRAPQPGRRGSTSGGRGEQSNTNSHRSATVTRSDETGVFRLTREDDKTTFSVRMKDGTEKSWPVNTDAERGEVPEEFRGKLQDMEKIRHEMNPGMPRGGPEEFRGRGAGEGEGRRPAPEGAPSEGRKEADAPSSFPPSPKPPPVPAPAPAPRGGV